jgi:hypothetical protein
LKVKVSFKPHVNLRGTCLKEQAAKKKCNFFDGGVFCAYHLSLTPVIYDNSKLRIKLRNLLTNLRQDVSK